MAKELGLQIGKSDAPQLAVEKAAAGKGKGGKGKKAKEATTPAALPPQQAQHDPIKVPRHQPVSDTCQYHATSGPLTRYSTSGSRVVARLRPVAAHAGRWA